MECRRGTGNFWVDAGDARFCFFNASCVLKQFFFRYVCKYYRKTDGNANFTDL